MKTSLELDYEIAGDEIFSLYRKEKWLARALEFDFDAGVLDLVKCVKSVVIVQRGVLVLGCV